MYRVKPGSTLRLEEVDPNHVGELTEAAAKSALQTNTQSLERLQYWMRAERKHSLLVVLQGTDAAGKDGVVRHVGSAFNPDGCTVHNFKVPTEEEAAHDFLWRVHLRAPAKGCVAIFNRSHYEAVLVERVKNLAPPSLLAGRYDAINDFERLLVEQNGTAILKFFLHVSKEEQAKRLLQRIKDPDRNWKVAESDFTDRALWKNYRKAFEEALERTSTKHAPWFVVPANHKWYRDYAVSKALVDAMEKLAIRKPEPVVDVRKVRKLLD